jgi:predicted DNA-binding transcriptional regulator YafY
MASGTARLLTLLELLQSHETITGSDIAARMDVDVRSVRRYIRALQAMGIPVEAERGRYGAYWLDRGFRLPPMMFSEDEAVALTLGLMVMRALPFPVDAPSVTGALAKIERVMPQSMLERSRALQAALHFSTFEPPVTVEAHLVQLLTRAIDQRQRVRITYQAWQAEGAERDIDPYGIVFHDGWWYAVGYCHLRRDVRTFRLDRIQSAEKREATFAFPSDFDVKAHVVRSLSDPPGIASIEVVFEASLEGVKRALPPELGTLEAIEGGVRFRRPAYRMDWVAALLLAVPFPFRVVQPPELVTMMRALAKRAAAFLDDDMLDTHLETALHEEQA